MLKQLNEDIKYYNGIIEDFKDLESSDFTTAYTLSQVALITADRWNEIMLNSVKYSKELEVTKSEFTSYCYQKFKMLMKIHEMCRCVWRQGEENQRYNYYGEV